jgi:surfeit locus 1 family protein
MRVGNFEFRAALAPTIAAILAIGLTAWLGRWQAHRAEDKRVLQRALVERQELPPILLTGREQNEEGLWFRRLLVKGVFDPSKEILLDNKVENGQAGYHVLTPLAIAGSQRYVLVNRGWVARGSDYPKPPEVKVPSGAVRIEGYGAMPTKRFLELSSQVVQGKVWENLTFERYRNAMHIDTLHVIIEQVNDTGDGLKRVRERPDTGISVHEGYAFQWFALCAAIVVTYFVVNTKHVRN